MQETDKTRLSIAIWIPQRYGDSLDQLHMSMLATEPLPSRFNTAHGVYEVLLRISVRFYLYRVKNKLFSDNFLKKEVTVFAPICLSTENEVQRNIFGAFKILPADYI